MSDTQLRISAQETLQEPKAGHWFRVWAGEKKVWCCKVEDEFGITFKNISDKSLVHVPSGWYVFRSNAGKKPYYTLCSPELYKRDVTLAEEFS